MTEIEKMYKLAKVKTINIAEYGSTYIPNNVKIDGELYPPFTAEKQLELIKRLFKISDIENINIECEDKFCIHNVLGQSDDCDTLEDALASYINDIWQSLTDQEKEEIRGILNENS